MMPQATRLLRTPGSASSEPAVPTVDDHRFARRCPRVRRSRGRAGARCRRRYRPRWSSSQSSPAASLPAAMKRRSGGKSVRRRADAGAVDHDAPLTLATGVQGCIGHQPACRRLERSRRHWPYCCSVGRSCAPMIGAGCEFRVPVSSDAHDASKPASAAASAARRKFRSVDRARGRRRERRGALAAAPQHRHQDLRMTPHATRAPELPVGCVLKSSGSLWTITPCRRRRPRRCRP